LYPQLIIVLGIVFENHTVDLVSRSTQPTFLNVVQNDLDLRLGAAYVGELADRDTEGASQETTEMSSRVRKLVFLTITLLEGDEDTHIVLSRKHFDGCARELGRDLVKATGGQTPLGAGNVESADGRMVGSLFGEIRDECTLLIRVRGGQLRAIVRNAQRRAGRVLISLRSSLECGEAVLGSRCSKL
jgi:hypothetical protein